MKKVFITFLFCGFVICGYSQATLETTSYRIGSTIYPVILPNLTNLVRIVNMDVSTFKSTMAKYRYHPSEDEGGSSYVFTNESIDFYLDGNNGRGSNTIMFDPTAGKNKFAGFRVFNKQAYPVNCIADLYQELAPYYTKTQNGTRYYVFSNGGYNYGINMIPLSQHSGTIVQIYKFNVR